MNNPNSMLRGMAGLAAGMLIGAGAALLVAPHSGQVTRSLLLNKGMEAKATLEDDLDHWRWQINNEIKQLITDARRKGVRIERDARDTIELELDALRQTVHDAPPLVAAATSAHHNGS